MAEGVKLKEIEKGLAAYEQGFNLLGYLPGVSQFSSPYRMMYGTLQAATGVALTGINGVKAVFTLDSEERSKNLKEATNMLVYTGHGIANMGRAYVESYFLLNLLGLVWDVAGMRFKYSVEKDKAGKQLTMDMITKNVVWVRNKINALLTFAS